MKKIPKIKLLLTNNDEFDSSNIKSNTPAPSLDSKHFKTATHPLDESRSNLLLKI